ncbi:hypothetical protein [Alkaliphilus hydrothermalis]|uniref:Uncharacterized protein n=1 Tax=Alkaliphilus hydrothermalis TaxID=1482730 RepID=A0ABS2NTB7_9FIRM|nr:hypothetical protein [Alkaliphilus hydrothermalis]MBM7616214.1 hypothetical protein [Alkaliphilus hydrothermalis]
MKLDEDCKKNSLKKLNTILENGFDFSGTVISFVGEENCRRDKLVKWLEELLVELSVPVVSVEYQLDPNWILYQYYKELPYKITKADEEQFYLLREFTLACDLISFYDHFVKTKSEEGYCIIWKNSPVYNQILALKFQIDMEWIINSYNIIPNSDISFIISNSTGNSDCSDIMSHYEQLGKISTCKAIQNVHYLNQSSNESLFLDIIDLLSKIRKPNK